MFQKKPESAASGDESKQKSTFRGRLLSLRRRSSDAPNLTPASPTEKMQSDFVQSLPPLHRAIYAGDDIKFSEWLNKKAGKKLDLLQADKTFGRNPLHYCAMQGRLSYLIALLPAARNYQMAEQAAQALDREGLTSLMLVRSWC